jgi:flagellin-specific chaperone FliS
MRNRERDMVEEVADLLDKSADIIATLVETRDIDEEDAVGYDLRRLYSELNRLRDDVEDMGYEL